MQSVPDLLVVVLGTGGTIAGVADSAGENLRYRCATLAVDALLAALPAFDGIALESEQVAQVDSKDMAFSIWQRLAGRVAHHAARPAVAGIVITHGTDTLEETAYFLSRVLRIDKPVVLTGAMRPATSHEADGPGNLADAIGTAARSGEPGVVVVMAGVIHSARDARKMHPSRLDAFSSGDAAARGRVEHGRPDMPAWPRPEPTLGTFVLDVASPGWPWVEIVTSDVGADGRVVAALSAAGVDGIVVAATGNGTVHHALESALVAAMAAGVRVMRSTRCVAGGIVPGAELEAIPSAGDLTPVKARIELMLRLHAERPSAVAPVAVPPVASSPQQRPV